MMWYLALAILLLVAVAMMLLVKRRQHTDYGMQAANRELYEARLQELQVELDEGKISTLDYDTAVLELKKTFVTENLDDERPVKEAPASMLVPVLALVGITLGLYFGVGDSWRQQHYADEALERLPEVSQRIMGDATQAASPDEVELFALGLRQRLHQDPDAGAWMLYGRIMMQMRQLEQAIEAFEQSLALDSDRVSTLIAHAQALILMGSDADLAQAARNIRHVLEQQATNTEALGLLGIVAYERGDYEQAVQAWNLTLRVLDPADPRYAAIEESVERAQQRISGDIMFLTVTVDITDELRNEMPPQTNLFVFVRDPDGIRAPAAVMRQVVAELPVTVTLSEDNAMVEGHTLATISSWLVGARLTTGDSIDMIPGVMEARPRLLDKEPGQQIELIISEMH